MWSKATKTRNDNVPELDRSKWRSSRVSGTRLRATAELLLRMECFPSLYAVSGELSRCLGEAGVTAHRRTVRRYLSGEVISVPAEVVEVMDRIVMERMNLGSVEAVERSMLAAGIERACDDEPQPVSSHQFQAFVQLWLHLNPDVSKRSLARRLERDLRKRQVPLAASHIMSLLSGGAQVVRREVYDTVLVYLSEHGVRSEEEAVSALEDLSSNIATSVAERDFVGVQRFQLLCWLWQIHHHDASASRLANLLQTRLAQRGVSITTGQVAKSIIGKARHVRRLLVTVIEELVSEIFPSHSDLDRAISELLLTPEKVTDLFWVSAQAVADMAEEWLSQHSGQTMRQLAIRTSQTLWEMSYPRSPNALEPILAGQNRRTRGYVYRAVLMQFDDVQNVEIPEELIVEPSVNLLCTLSELTAHQSPTEREQDEDDDLESGPVSGESVSARQYLLAMREHLPSAVSENFLAFAAYRAEQMFDIPREQAKRIIRGRLSLPTD